MIFRTRIAVALTASALSLVACDEDPSSQAFGSMDLTTSAPAIEKEIVTVDGWTVKYARFLVHLSSEVAGSDGVIAASDGPRIVDQVAPGAKSILSATLRSARPWEAVSIQVTPAAVDPETETLFDAPVTAADRDAMQKDGLSLLVVGTATKNGVVKSFTWGFSTDTLYKDCGENRGSTFVPGLVVPADGSDTADVGMSGEGLFADSLVGPGELRGDAFAAADADNDNTVTFDELRALPLDTARTFGGAYATPETSEVGDLGAFVEARTQALVTRFRGAGSCTAEPVVSEE